MTESFSELTPNLGLPYLWPAQAQKHVTHNDALQRVDALSQIVLLGVGVLSAPAMPVIGGLWAIGIGASGVWSGQDGNLALWDGTGWHFIVPKAGWLAWDDANSRLCRHDGAAWLPYTPAHLQGLGIGTAPDLENRLAVRAPASLFTHEGEGHQLKVNKATSTDTASLLFQTDWSGHAEIGLNGNDDLTVKVSADGSTWQTALQVSADTGGVVMNGPVTGGAVTQTPDDQTSGRLMKTGDGGILGPIANEGFDLNNSHYGFWANGLADEAPLHAPREEDALWAGWHVGNDAAGLQFAGRCDGGGLYARSRVDDLWGSWRAVYDQDSAIGPVTFSGGRNTGAVVESGTVSGAHYMRLACGTQICWGTVSLASHAVTQVVGGLFGSDIAAAITFAKTFHTAPSVTVALVSATSAPALWPAQAEATTAGASCRFLSATSITPLSIVLTYQAVGRWRA